MESNQELFKQAILDAKAVRETSLAAARTTLAEHFEPLVRDMFRETVENIEESDLLSQKDDTTIFQASDQWRQLSMTPLLSHKTDTLRLGKTIKQPIKIEIEHY